MDNQLQEGEGTRPPARENGGFLAAAASSWDEESGNSTKGLVCPVLGRGSTFAGKVGQVVHIT